MALLEFFGTECPHCRRMEPLVTALEKELGMTVQKYETWHDAENDKLRASHDNGDCGGVPFFVNEESGQKLCGAVPYERLKAWAKGEEQE